MPALPPHAPIQPGKPSDYVILVWNELTQEKESYGTNSAQSAEAMYTTKCREHGKVALYSRVKHQDD